MLILYVGVFLLVLFIGWLYDKIFTLWKEHQNVVLERNPWQHIINSKRCNDCWLFE